MQCSPLESGFLSDGELGPKLCSPVPSPSLPAREGSGAGLACDSPGCSVLPASSPCLPLSVGMRAGVGGGLGCTQSCPHPVLCRVWREEFPFRAQLGRRGQRGERDAALGLRVWRSEVLSLLAPLRATVAVATDQRATAGGAQQDQSGQREWCLGSHSRWLMGLETTCSLQLFECLPAALSASPRLGPSPWGSAHAGWGACRKRDPVSPYSVSSPPLSLLPSPWSYLLYMSLCTPGPIHCKFPCLLL